MVGAADRRGKAGERPQCDFRRRAGEAADIEQGKSGWVQPGGARQQPGDAILERDASTTEMMRRRSEPRRAQPFAGKQRGAAPQPGAGVLVIAIARILDPTS